VRPPGSLTPRNRLIVQQRAAGRTVQSIAAEHGLSPARVSVICRDHALSIRVAELEAERDNLLHALRQANKNVDRLRAFYERLTAPVPFEELRERYGA
jgi:hypothetical protein